MFARNAVMAVAAILMCYGSGIAEKLRPISLSNHLVSTGGITLQFTPGKILNSAVSPDTVLQFNAASYDTASVFLKGISLSSSSVTAVVSIEVSANGEDWIPYADVDSVTVGASPDTVLQYNPIPWPGHFQHARAILTARSDSLLLTGAITLVKLNAEVTGR